MTNLQKTVIAWLGAAVLFMLFVFLSASTTQKINTAPATNTVSFGGQGKVLAKPDVAIVDFSIVTESEDSKTAQDQNSAKSKTVIDFLKKQNIDDKDIKTSSYNIFPQYRYPQFDKPEIRGYQVNQMMEVKIRDLDKVSAVLDGVVSAGVNQVNNLRLTIDDPDKLKKEARAKAITDAKNKAANLRKQLGVSLGKIVNFSENVAGSPIPVFFDRAAGGGLGGGGPSVPAGENEVVVDITITYQIK